MENCKAVSENDWSNGTSQSPSWKLRFPRKMILLSLMTSKSCFPKIAKQLSSHNCPIERRDEFFKSGKKKREINYKESSFNLNESFITREWNINGKLIYDRSLFIRE